MKITEDILKAMQNCINGVGSITEFSQQSNITIDTITKYLSRQTKFIQHETWLKLQPLLQPYLLKNGKKGISSRPKISSASKHLELNSDEKILLDAFAELPKDIRNQKLLEIVEIAKNEVKKQNEGV
ncbi:MAG: hypothetical protein PHV75_02795 [Victivallaceae bacterium]|jgi:hypothetical protein|nr:hypothetical protein [Victivallaceae bacterium]NLK84115.1 hypothetical protein [Lentisphaerota bacterium]MDD3116162.1 hypothetical protein [Victivallaceae bacterium]MDD3702968.1 hypothetical protein [Victivallaceae bacterium]MDD4317427.1 hypothetical protein [Victivallaceae bacterium]